MPEPVLRAERLTYRYPEAAGPSLNDLSVEIEPGSFTIVAGESGSGKSTLLRAACGLVPHFHGGEVSGELEVGGLTVRHHGPGELAAVCGTVFQDPETQVVMGGVRSELALALEHRGESPPAVTRAVEEVALALGIAHLLERRTDTLSGGELQRVALGAALVHRPSLLILDEPTSQLDPVAGDELVWMLRRLNEDWGTAVVMAEHRLERCLGAADRVLVLEEGRVSCDSDPEGFLQWATAERPALATPAARLFSLAGLGPLPASVKQARAGLGPAGLVPDRRALELPGRGVSVPSAAGVNGSSRPPGRRFSRRGARRTAALHLRDVWHELRDGPAILRGVNLELAPGDRAALMGRNGAGKSTVLRHARGLLEPTRGRVERSGPVALLLQNPGDYLVHERAVDEAGPAALVAAGLEGRETASPRDLSGGERQRLALEVALGVGRTHAAVCLDEPTRGMDRGRKEHLARRLEALSRDGAAVLVATHDTEFAAEFAERVILMGDGEVLADAAASDVLAGGWHFSTEVARVLGGAGGALTPHQGLRVLRRELVS